MMSPHHPPPPPTFSVALNKKEEMEGNSKGWIH